MGLARTAVRKPLLERGPERKKRGAAAKAVEPVGKIAPRMAHIFPSELIIDQRENHFSKNSLV